jgi:hypothetical protein
MYVRIAVPCMYSANITLLWVCIWPLIHTPVCVQPKVLRVPLMGLLFLKEFESCLLKNELLYLIIRYQISFYETMLLGTIHVFRNVRPVL